MASLANKHGGGSKTNINGLHFEQTTSLNDALINKGYTIKNGYDVYKDNKKSEFQLRNVIYTKRF